ncbi:hypothetical protein PVK06_009473 [Gossypium arboreum]|uniref:Myosin motor domain-containing protein n=1 Tax=Gossypium arboreum TaxID=29729 RepID=A0ABR0QMK4_GOSAR|nr:hypothetical protein PVK06_009473 [Gossypium arboreum]
MAQSPSHITNVIFESNPVLEAFGNAKTVRNNNQVWIEIKYNTVRSDINCKLFSEVEITK